MLEFIPCDYDVETLLGHNVFVAWKDLFAFLDYHYDMDAIWDEGGKAGVWEVKIRGAGKTLCAFYARQHRFGFMLIFGKNERAEFEKRRHEFSHAIQNVYDSAQTFHDGKWMMFEIFDRTHLPEIEKLVQIKKKPNAKH